MMSGKDIAMILATAYEPTELSPRPVPARSLRGAIRNLDREAELLLAETRACYPINETLQELAARM